MDRTQLVSALVAVLVLVLAGAWLEAKWRILRDRHRAREAAKRGFAGERDAEKLLKKLGYKLVSRHAPASYGMLVDGEPQSVQLQVDFLLELNGKKVIAEVKTGKAAKLEQAETRRQLLEYQLAFGVDALLLIDIESKQVRTVRFPLPKKKAAVAPTPAGKRSALRWAVIALLAVGTTWLVRTALRDAAPAASE